LTTEQGLLEILGEQVGSEMKEGWLGKYDMYKNSLLKPIIFHDEFKINKQVNLYRAHTHMHINSHFPKLIFPPI
jgi:hypothetical protein